MNGAGAIWKSKSRPHHLIKIEMSTAVKKLTARERKESASLKIGDVSRLSGVGVEALRFYEKSGLLNRPSRNVSGYRVYDREALDRLAFIKRAQALGFSLDEIKQIIAEARHGHSPCEDVREIVRHRLKELDERTREMQRYRKELSAELAEWDRVGERKGHICGLIEGTNIRQGIEHGMIKTKKASRGKK